MVHLSTGPLHLAAGRLQGSPRALVGGAAPVEGSWVVTLESSAVGDAHEVVSAALAPCGGSVVGFLPPAALHVHVHDGARAGACAAALGALPGVSDFAALPPHALVHASVARKLQQGQEGGRAPALRVLAVSLARGGGSTAALSHHVAALARAGECPRGDREND